jgi:NTE family protein
MDETETAKASWWQTARQWLRAGRSADSARPRIGLALGGGFARAITHVGVLRVFERNDIRIGAVSGVSSGAIMAAAIASGSTAQEIEEVALSMKFRDVARWSFNLQGLARSDRMIAFLARLLKVSRFEDMRIPLAIVAADLLSGKAVTFRGQGDVVLPIRASCAYPGLFSPIRYQGRLLVDGFVASEVPALPLLQMGAQRVVSVALPSREGAGDYSNMFAVVSRCFQVMSARTENDWRRHSHLVISPPVANMAWDSFASAKQLIQIGEEAAEAALPTLRRWLQAPAPVAARQALLSPRAPMAQIQSD